MSPEPGALAHLEPTSSGRGFQRMPVVLGDYGGHAEVAGSPRCRSCGAPIWFGLTAKGKRMPMDLAPVEDGNVVVDYLMATLDQLASAYEGDQPPPDGCRVRVLAKGETPGPDVPRYVSHFATCPSAQRHRREDRPRNGSKAGARAMGLEARS